MTVGYGIVFQGIEEHTGTPFCVDNQDISEIPYGYEQETRINIITYPKAVIMDGSLKINFMGKKLDENPNRSLWMHASSCFGGIQAYNAWRQRTLATLIHEYSDEVYGLKHLGLSLDRNALLSAITWKDKDPNTLLLSEDNFQTIKQNRQRLLDRMINIRNTVKSSLQRPFYDMKHSSKQSKVVRQEILTLSSDSSSGSSADQSAETTEDETESETEQPSRKRHQTHQRASSSQLLQDQVSSLANIISIGSSNVNTMERLASPVHSTAAASIDTVNVHQTGNTGSLNSLFHCFQECFKQDQLDLKTAEIKTRPAFDLNLQKGFRSLESVPVLEKMDDMTPVERIRACQAYTEAFYLFQEKADAAEIVKLGFQSAFLTLLIEFIGAMKNPFLNIWEDPETLLPHASFAMQLQTVIDDKFRVWEEETQSKTYPHSNLEVSAKEVLGNAYNPRAHLDVSLEPRPGRLTPSNTSYNKGIILENVIYGMCFSKPVERFLENLGCY
ncbi:MAG: hypothetical protein M1824_002469 [Vezdaea acicularis]|nr:MAG: hypothetical protein M1824_002469 [Vezdaea acicularis]